MEDIVIEYQRCRMSRIAGLTLEAFSMFEAFSMVITTLLSTRVVLL